MTWLHEAPSNGKSTAKKNGLTCFWCNKRVRYTSYKSSECTKTTKREKSTAFAAIASVDVNLTMASSIASAADWSEIDEETQPGRKKINALSVQRTGKGLSFFFWTKKLSLTNDKQGQVLVLQ